MLAVAASRCTVLSLSLAAPHILFVFVSLGFERKPETFLSCCRFSAQMFRCKLSQPDWKRLFPTNAHLSRGSGWSLQSSLCLGACRLGTWNQGPCYTLCFWGSLLNCCQELRVVLTQFCAHAMIRFAGMLMRTRGSVFMLESQLKIHIRFLLELPAFSPVILYLGIGSLIFGPGWMDGESNIL